MTAPDRARRSRPPRVATPVLLEFEATVDDVRAEYRYRQRVDPAAADRWLAARTLLLRDVAETDHSLTTQSVERASRKEATRAARARLARQGGSGHSGEGMS